MPKIMILWLAVLLLAAGPMSCVEYSSRSLDTDTNTNPGNDDSAGYVLPEGVEASVVGRLWVNPNPAIFGDFEGVPVRHILVEIGAIGTEPIVVEEVSLSGDPRIGFQEDPDELFPKEMGSPEECHSWSSTEFVIVCEQETEHDIRSTLTVHTNDPTSPSQEIPIRVDYNVEVEDPRLYPIQWGPNPLVKPNPIRLVASGGEQSVDLCFSFVTSVGSWRVLGMQVIGEGLELAEVLQFGGEPAILPTPEVEHPELPYWGTLTYRPDSAEPLDGALVVEIVDWRGRISSLAVPILVR
jgi:hypothetical protein